MNRAMGIACTIIGLCALAARVGVSGEPAATVNEVRQLLQANGMWDLSAQVGAVTAQQLSLALHRTNPSLPASADSVVAHVVGSYLKRSAEENHVADRLIPIYTKYLTKSDVQQLTAFYRSPAGRKLMAATPAISLESAEVGQDWMKTILPGLQAEVLSELKSEKLLE